MLVHALYDIYHTEPMPRNDSNSGKEITLRDVIFHIQGVQSTIRSMEKEIRSNMKAIKANAIAIKHLEDSMNQRFDALEEDLIATTMDTMEIKKFVGMPLPNGV